MGLFDMVDREGTPYELTQVWSPRGRKAMSYAAIVCSYLVETTSTQADYDRHVGQNSEATV